MTASQLDAIEAAVGFPLPAEYRRVALEYPFRPIGRDCVYWFYDDPSEVIDGTLAPLPDGGYDGTGWKHGYLVIGCSAAGDPYVLDTGATGLPVYCLSHDTHAIEPEWPTFAAFVGEWMDAPERVAGTLAAEQAAEMLAKRKRFRLALLIVGASIGLPLIALLILSQIG